MKVLVVSWIINSAKATFIEFIILFTTKNMTRTIFIKDIMLTNATIPFLLQSNWIEGNSIKYQLQDLFDNYKVKVKSNVDHLFASTTDDQNNLDALAVNDMGEMIAGRCDDAIIGIANATASTDSKADSEIILVADNLLAQADSEATADANALAIGIENKSKIKTNKGHDIILGVANATASGNSIANSQAELVLSSVPAAAISNSVAKVNVLAEAVGISNASHIATGIGHDLIIGVAKASASGSSMADSQALALSSNDSSATANSNALTIVDTLAIGIDNVDKITTGKGDDIIIGAASTSAMSEAEAKAFAHNTTALVNECDPAATIQVETAFSSSTSAATANSRTTTLGIINSGKIFMDRGNDVIIGLAYSKNSSNAQTISYAESIANSQAIAIANANSSAIAEGTAVGIANLGKINTGRGNDFVIGIAINAATADADADADAVAVADDSNAQTDSSAIADTANAIAIGIDNTSGLLITANGNDQVVGIGDIGIIGGNLRGGSGHDRIIGYGNTVGVANSKIELGKGNDFFKAAIVNFDPFTGETSFLEDQSGAIKDASIFGDRGNDTFEIGGFESNVAIDGGRHHDVVKLWGSIDDYDITLASSGDKALTIENSDGILAVKNVEEFYFGNSDQAYSYHDFA